MLVISFVGVLITSQFPFLFLSPRDGSKKAFFEDIRCSVEADDGVNLGAVSRLMTSLLFTLWGCP